MSGWEPVSVTRYEYDDEGRLVGSVSEREPEWSDTDRQSLLAYVESLRVGPHGHPMSEATSAAADPSNIEREYEYIAPPPTRDYAQSALVAAQEAYKAKYPDANTESLLWRVERRQIQ